MAAPEAEELVFVVDVTSFTRDGFVGSSSFGGSKIDIEFDDQDEGLTLDARMCKKIHAKSGTPVRIVIDDEPKLELVDSTIKSVGDRPRISNAKVYYIIGRNGGGIFRVGRS